MSSEQTTISNEELPVFQRNEKKMRELAESANAIKIGGKVVSFFFRFDHLNK